MKKKIFILMVCVILSIALCACGSKNTDVKETKRAQMSSEVETKSNSETNITSEVYPIQIDIGTEYAIDLNGDGSNDTVSYDTAATQQYQNSISSLKVNGVEYVDQLDDLGIFMENPNLDWYYIVDIDESDKYKEIAILDEGPSCDPETHFLRFNGGSIEYIGSITDFPSESTCVFWGTGTIVAKYRLSILQTWWAPGKWKLDQNGYLSKVQEEIYYPYVFEYETTNPVLIKDIKLFTSQDLNSEQITVISGKEVSFIGTDNEHWVWLRTSDGIEGWFYVENNMYIIQDGNQVENIELFNNLCFAD